MPNPRLARIIVTAVMGLIAALAFTFSFGNVWALALRLGIPHPIAPLIAPMVDLSVVGLLVALRYLAMAGIDRAELRPATRLMHISGLLTLALNTAEPLILAHWGRAALDAVAPLLLLGWGAVGPLLLRHLHIPTTTETATTPETSAQTNLPESTPAAAVATVQLTANESAERGPAPDPAPVPPAAPFPVPAALLASARQLDQQHRDHHGQPMTPAQLRTRLSLPVPLADALYAELVVTPA